jgi:poly(3-hydroxybutyrate) depolymerase
MGALSAMKTGAKPDAPGGLRSRQARPGRAVPLIVFHGDADPTVHARNGEQLVSAALAAATGAQAVEQVHAGQSAAGQRYVRTVYSQAAPAGAPAAGSVLAEHWVLQGAGHAWSGGRAGASHTDPRGVDATAEMLRFFLAHRRGAGN